MVGAGLSVKSGWDLWPVATEKALSIASSRGMEQAAFAYATRILQKRDLYGVFDIIAREFDAAAYRNIVLETFNKSSKANATQKSLIAVPSRGIITTNFDDCLTAACVHIRNETPLASIPDVIASRAFFVAQPHGTIRQFDSMVLKNADWQDVLRKGELRDLLAQIVSQNQLIILGYSMSDPDFQHIWQDLLSERIFRETALLCCGSGSLSNEKKAEFLTRNIQVIEFNDPAQDFSYLDDLLESMARPATTVVASAKADGFQIPSVVRTSGEDLEHYVMLCLEFSPSNKSRLETICRAILLEHLADLSVPVSTEILIEHVILTLSDSSATIRNSASNSLNKLLESTLVSLGPKGLMLNARERLRLKGEVAKAKQEETDALNHLISSLRTQHGTQLDLGEFRALVDRAFSYFGSEVAEFFLYNKPARVASEKIDSITQEYFEGRDVSTAHRSRYADALKHFILQPSDQYARVVFRKLQSYFITSAYVLDPTSTRLMSEYARGHSVYLDSSIVLPAMAIGHPSQRLYHNLLTATLRLGMRLFISREMLDEVTSNIRTAVSAFVRFRKSKADLRDILSGYTSLQGKGNGNVFLEGFQGELELDASLTPENYMRMVMAGTEQLSESATIGVLNERFGIELDPLRENDLNSQEVRRLTDEVAFLRKSGNRFKNELLCKHEAIQFALLQRRRQEDPSRRAKIWFVTTDYFFTELQRREKNSYPLPVSYTPRMWLQYLNLLDFDSRGERNFARLQQKMNYGVASGGMGLTAIYLILHEKKTLLEKGLATVKDMADAIVSEYHLQHSIEDYEYGAKSVDRNSIAKTMRVAVNKLTVIRTKEIEQLKVDKEAAVQRAAALEKRLAKQKYIRRTTNPDKLKPKKRR